jgi:polygalacturonase
MSAEAEPDMSGATPEVAPEELTPVVALNPAAPDRASSPPAPSSPAPSSPALAPELGPIDEGIIGWERVPLIIERIVPPTFPDLDCDITSYGGVGDGVTDNSAAFAAAIADCASRGGGRVVAPLGQGPSTTFFTGPIELKSHINLYVPAGVTIKFSTDPDQYLPVVKVSYEGNLLYNYRPLISAHDATDVAITGGGTLDGNATPDDWYAWLALSAEDTLALRVQNATGVPIEQRVYGAGHFLRPSLIELMNVTNVLFDGFTAQNSPFWSIHPVLSKNITARNLRVLANQPNTDGFDPESSLNVLVDNVTIQVGDDPIAIKAGRDRDGWSYYTPTENVVIQNCSFNSGNPTHGAAIAIGSEMSAGVRHVYAQDITFTSVGGVLAQAIYMKASVYRGGFIENFYARRLTVDAITTFFFLNGQYSAGAVPADAPRMFTNFNNINVDGATVNSVLAEGFRITGPDATVLATNINISNVTIQQAATAIRPGAAHYSGLNVSNVVVNGAAFTPPESVP